MTNHFDQHRTDLHTAGHAVDDDTLARLLLTTWHPPGSPTIEHLVQDRGAERAARLLLDAPDDGVIAADADALELAQSVRSQLRLGQGPARQIAEGFDFIKAHPTEVELLTPDHDLWPRRLNDLDVRTPLVLWARGDLELLGEWRTVNITGARAATAYGEHVTSELTTQLAHRSQRIINNASYGIDSSAQRTALANDPAPIIVTATGLDRSYPAGNADLLKRVAQRGLVITEQPVGTPPTRLGIQNIQRLQAALSHSTIVVEAGNRSSALHTAEEARLLGHFVGAVPGPVTSSASAGANRLLQTGTARVVTHAVDIPIVASDPSVGPMTREPLLLHHDAPHGAAHDAPLDIASAARSL